MTTTRVETDSFGPLDVPSDKYWGAQTQRSLINFPIGWEKQPIAIVRALGVIKQGCAMANTALGKLPEDKGKAIQEAAGAREAGRQALTAQAAEKLERREERVITLLNKAVENYAYGKELFKAWSIFSARLSAPPPRTSKSSAECALMLTGMVARRWR